MILDDRPNIFATLVVPPDHPVYSRPPTRLTLDRIVEAGHIATFYSSDPEIAAFGPAIVCMKLTPAEFCELCQRAERLAARN